MSARIATASRPPDGERLYHGGIPGLSPGDFIVPAEPHFVAGCAWCEAKKRGKAVHDPLRAHVESVYVTTDRAYARFYASKFPRGDLYAVEIEGEAIPSDEDHFPTWRCPKARVLKVYERYVRMTPTQRRSLLRRWAAADGEPFASDPAFIHLGGPR